ncbi:tRNA (cytidine(34)-2'-O)-methyltransferase [Chlamydia sp. 17-3921]|uniref:tRNA (cytidine(34)-2'-O)-methyltransferase n=1 Tax=Chlamydia sp. 17-3921 TaxID=2675798 RepID=UPI00191A2475|nr:tRNA (cytidine(34)-2'-O)-methyltransferase [Chlamydia sp. 17-3921]
MKVVLVSPDIPQNTGNIGRTCVALGAELILVRPLGFSLLDKFVKRAGMDYWSKLNLKVVDSLEDVLKDSLEENIFCFSTKGSRYYADAPMSNEGVFIFGSESKGLPKPVLEKYRKRCYFVPMFSEARSLNLATTVGIVLYEVVRQNFLSFAFSDNFKRVC